MDKENITPQPPKRNLRSFVKPAILVAAFTIIMAYAFFHFGELRKVGATLLDAVNPFITGLFIAYILNVFMNLFEHVVFGRWSNSQNKIWNAVRRPLCVVLAFAVVILIILAIVLYIIPEIIQSLDLIVQAAKVNIPIYAQTLTVWVTELSEMLNLDLMSEVSTLLKKIGRAHV